MTTMLFCFVGGDAKCSISPKEGRDLEGIYFMWRVSLTHPVLCYSHVPPILSEMGNFSYMPCVLFYVGSFS